MKPFVALAAMLGAIGVVSSVDASTLLVGKPFISNWNGLTMADLADRVRTSMPPDNPRSVPRPAIADILAFILAQNKFPSGQGPSLRRRGSQGHYDRGDAAVV